MKINIASYGGRSHLLDTARELSNLNYDVKFYSYLPSKRASKFGLKKECNASYFFLALPFLALLKISKRAHWSLFLFHYVFDHIVAWYMRPCDVYIAQSPMHVYSLIYAKEKYGAKIIVERGTRHVLEQIKALKTNPALNGKNPMPDVFLKRDLKGYELADYITVPSEVVKESFLKNSFSNTNIFVNPYGVNLKEFRPTVLESTQTFDLIIVGQWSHRKGCDLLVEVCEKEGFSLLHVGGIVDLPFPNGKLFTHIDPVEQQVLISYYSKAKVFVLPSREEGLALVQPQALVCGLPLVCSQFTGGRDLRQFIDDPKWIIEMKDYTSDELIKCIKQGLTLASTQDGVRTHLKNLNSLSWNEYGKRYDSFLNNHLAK